MPWILRGAKAFKLIPLVIVLVLVIVLGNGGKQIEHEQEHEHDYEKEDLPGNIRLAQKLEAFAKKN